MSLTVIEYTCKFCGHKRALEADLTECPPLEVEKWKQILVCNRCADFTRSRKDAEAAIVKCCVALITARQTRRGDKLKEFEGAISERFTGLTKWFASIVCKHYGRSFEWEVEFVNQIMEKPDTAGRMLNFYHRNTARATTQEVGVS